MARTKQQLTKEELLEQASNLPLEERKALWDAIKEDIELEARKNAEIGIAAQNILKQINGGTNQ